MEKASALIRDGADEDEPIGGDDGQDEDDMNPAGIR